MKLMFKALIINIINSHEVLQMSRLNIIRNMILKKRNITIL